MATAFPDIISAVGNTPLIKLNRIASGLEANIYVKCEFFNPLASVKDRIGKAMIEAGEREGKLGAGSVVVEPTSGNTGIALAFVCASKGYRCILIMPDTMSMERRVLLRMLGAEIVLTPGAEGMKGAIARSEAVANEIGEKAFIPSQFDNPANPEVHRKTTAEEIWDATEGNIDAFVAGVGTGGTITGVAEVIKSRRELLSVAVEPEASPILSGGKPGPHKIQGIGAGFIPGNLNESIVDEVLTVSNDVAFDIARKVSLTDGLAVGISSGATIAASLKLAERADMAGKTIVCIAASPSERYLSTPLAETAREEVAS